MTPLYATLFFLFSILVVGAAAVLIGAAQRRAEATARQAERAAAPADMAGLRQAAGLDPAGRGRGSIFRPLPGGGFFSERWGEEPASPAAQAVSGQTIPTGGIVINNWGGGHNSTTPQNQSPTNGDKNQGPKPWQQKGLFGNPTPDILG